MNDYGMWVKRYREGKAKCSERNMSQCYILHHKYPVNIPGIQAGHPLWDVGVYPSELWKNSSRVLNPVASWKHIMHVTVHLFRHRKEDQKYL